MKYDVKIDQQTWAFIHKTESFYSGEVVSPTIEQQRGEYNQMCRAFAIDQLDGLYIENHDWDGIPVRIYETLNSIGTVVYYHGGGFVCGDLESHDDVCAELAVKSQLRIVSVDYRLAPEHIHPAQFNDALQAVQIASNVYSAPLMIAGDSAGGNLAAAVSHHIRATDITLAGQILIYPILGTNMDKGSFVNHVHAPMLTLDDVRYYNDIRCENSIPENDPTFAPLDDFDFTGLPATVIFTAECDPLAEDGRDYCSSISNAGGKAHCVNEVGLVHGYLRARTTVDRAKHSFERIVAAAVALATNQWPY